METANDSRRTGVFFATQAFDGYEVQKSSRVDEELTLVGKGTPAGEYLRRFWQPLALLSDLQDVPVAVTLLGEELVIFRSLSGEIGLLHRHCSHRGASLEFGLIDERGLRCAYHGWRYAADGKILEAPAKTEMGKPVKGLCQGAYPIHEYKGIVFAYLGPRTLKPEFPVYDFMDAAGEDAIPYSWSLPCNWLQVRENAADPIHLTFLHSMFGFKQFGDFTPDIPVIRAHNTPLGQITTSVRQMNDVYYCRVNEMIMPNIARVPDSLRESGAIPENLAEGGSRYRRLIPASHGLGFSMWVIGNDDTHSTFFGWHHVPEDEAQAVREERVRQVTHGQTGGRPYAQRQRNPGDYDVIVSQGRNMSRDNEHLTSADAGIVMYRRQLREGIRAVQRGETPKGLDRIAGGNIPTYAHALVKPVDPAPSANEEGKGKLEMEKRLAADILAFRVPATSRVLEAGTQT
ncbi:MAG: aromatic ring-hydroxylating dioxygenase subunit alpha [Pseudomonadota bacterium]